MSEKMDNKYYQLVEDLKSGELNLTLIQMAIRAYVRQNKNIPEPIKDLLAGSGEDDMGYIYRQFQVMRDVMGKMELAYRRGTDKD